MEIDKVSDEVVDMVVNTEVDKVEDMLVKIPKEDYWYRCDWQLVILMEIILEVVMGMMYMKVDKVAKFSTNASGVTWWPNLQIMQVAPLGGQICN